MGSLATFKTTYLNGTAVPTPYRLALAGPVAAIEQRVADGATVTNARTQVTNNRAEIIVHKAQQTSAPYQSTLAADFYALDAP